GLAEKEIVVDADEVVAQAAARIVELVFAAAVVEEDRVEVGVVPRGGIDGVDPVEAEALRGLVAGFGAPRRVGAVLDDRAVVTEQGVALVEEALDELLDAGEPGPRRVVEAGKLPAGELAWARRGAAQEHVLELA